MPRYIALLRGINVGGNKKLPMADLRTLLEKLDCTGVVTLLQSGNAVFTSREKAPAKLAARIESAIVKRFGFESSVVLRTRDELEAAIRNNPFPGPEDPAHFLVVFLAGVPDPKRIAAIDAAKYQPNEFRAVGQEMYVCYREGIAGSKLAAVLVESKLGVVPTARNWNTVKKLLELADQPG